MSSPNPGGSFLNTSRCRAALKSVHHRMGTACGRFTNRAHLCHQHPERRQVQPPRSPPLGPFRAPPPTKGKDPRPERRASWLPTPHWFVTFLAALLRRDSHATQSPNSVAFSTLTCVPPRPPSEHFHHPPEKLRTLYPSPPAHPSPLATPNRLRLCGFACPERFELSAIVHSVVLCARLFSLSIRTVFVPYINRSMSYILFESGFGLCIMSVKPLSAFSWRHTGFFSSLSFFSFVCYIVFRR